MSSSVVGWAANLTIKFAPKCSDSSDQNDSEEDDPFAVTDNNKGKGESKRKAVQNSSSFSTGIAAPAESNWIIKLQRDTWILAPGPADASVNPKTSREYDEERQKSI